MKIMRIFLLPVLLLSLSAAAQNYQPVDTLFDEDPYYILMGEADAAIKREDWTEAAARLTDAISIKPDNPTNALLYSNLGAVYTALGNDSLALAGYNNALEIAPRMLTPLIGRGKLYLSMGNDKDAFADFARVIELDSINTDARFYHGMMALYGGFREFAEEDFKVLQDIAPRSSDTAIALSTLYSMTGRDSEAIPYLKKLIENSPAPEYYATLAGCYLNLDWLNEASETIGAGLKLFPDDPELYYYRAWLNRERYRLDDAHNDAKTAVRLGANPLKVDRLFK